MVLWVHRGWVAAASMVCQQKSQRKNYVRATTGTYFFNPFLTRLFPYESVHISSFNNFSKACFFHEEAVTER